MSRFLSAALAYADRGWRTFPIEPLTKRPYNGTRGFLDAACDPEQLALWGEAEPEAWLAVWCRGSGLVAIDVDPRNGGTETLARLEAKYGELPRDLVQQSGSGGLHLLYLDPSPGDNGWTRNVRAGGEARGKLDGLGLGLGCDVKLNGYCLVEGNGSPYRWLAFGDAPPLPDRWRDEVLRKPAAELGETPDGAGLEAWEHSSDPEPLTAADRERLRAELRALGPRKSGTSTTYRAVLKIFHDFGLGIADGREFLNAWNAGCGAPHAEHELWRKMTGIAESGRASGQRGQRRGDISRIQAVARAAYDWRSLAPMPIAHAPARATQPPPDAGADVAVSDAPDTHPPAPGTPRLPPPCEQSPDADRPTGRFGDLLEQAAQAVIDRLAIDKPVATLAPLFETAKSVRARRYPAAPWLVSGLITRGGVGAVSGEAKMAKSWMATAIVMAVAGAGKVFGKFPVEKPGRAAYFYAEDVGPSVQTRLNALAACMDLADGWDERLIVQPRGRTIDLTSDIDLATVIASVWMHGPIDLLVLDPLRDLHSGEEDKSDSMRPVMERVRALTDILNCAVFFVHHAGKASADQNKRRAGQRMRGSGAIHAALDVGIHMWDLRGNETTQFIAAVTSEIKAARSAGTFDLTLDIVDGKHGTAERASLTVSERAKDEEKEKGAKAGRPDPVIGDILMAMFDNGAAMTIPTISTKIRCNGGVVIALLSAGERAGLVCKVMGGTVQLGWGLTDKGRKTVQQGSSGQPEEAPPAPHPATSAICNLPPEK